MERVVLWGLFTKLECAGRLGLWNWFICGCDGCSCGDLLRIVPLRRDLGISRCSTFWIRIFAYIWVVISWCILVRIYMQGFQYIFCIEQVLDNCTSYPKSIRFWICSYPMSWSCINSWSWVLCASSKFWIHASELSLLTMYSASTGTYLTHFVRECFQCQQTWSSNPWRDALCLFNGTLPIFLCIVCIQMIRLSLRILPCNTAAFGHR